MVSSNKGTISMSNTFETTAQPVSFERTVANLKQNVEAASAAQAKVSERAMKTSKDFAAFSQGTLEAFAQASQIYARGSQDMFRQMTESSQAAFADTLATVRALVTAKTVKERIELQTNFVRTSANRAVAESSRFANAGIELAQQVAAPLTARAVAAAEAVAAAPKM